MTGESRGVPSPSTLLSVWGTGELLAGGPAATQEGSSLRCRPCRVRLGSLIDISSRQAQATWALRAQSV